MDIVSFEVAKFLYCTYRYKKDTVYMYDLFGRLHLSLEPEQAYLIPAPTVQEAVDFLWKVDIKIYYAPKKGKCLSLVMIGEDVSELRDLCNTPSESYTNSLQYLAKLHMLWKELKDI